MRPVVLQTVSLALLVSVQRVVTLAGQASRPDRDDNGNHPPPPLTATLRPDGSLTGGRGGILAPLRRVHHLTLSWLAGLLLATLSGLSGLSGALVLKPLGDFPEEL